MKKITIIFSVCKTLFSTDKYFYAQEFNHNLIGYAFGDSLTSHPASQLNVGEGGALSMDMPYMAKFLVNRMKKDPRIDIKNHWKVRISHKIHLF